MEPDRRSPPEVQPQADKFVEQQSIPHSSDGWLTPNGVFYQCTSTQHDECADFLNQKYENEVKEKNIGKDDEELPSRTRLEKTGFVLVHGNLLPSSEFANLTPEQIDKLKQAHITIINPATNEKCDPSIAQDVVTQIKNRMLIFQEHPELLLFEPTYNNWCVWYNLDEFKESPLTTYLVKTSENSSDPSINSVFDTLSDGWSEELKISYKREEFHVRITPIPNSDFFLTTTKYTYSHDGMSAGSVPDHRHAIHSRIETKTDLQEYIDKLLNSRYEHDPKIKLGKDSSLLSSFIEDIEDVEIVAAIQPRFSSSIELKQGDDKFPSQTIITKDSDGWLTPDGLFYPHTSVQQEECADFLNQKYSDMVKKNNLWWNESKETTSRTKLEKTGFVLVQKNTVFCHDLNRMPTQINLLTQAGITIIDPETNTEYPASTIKTIITKLQNSIPTITEYAKTISEEEKKKYKDLSDLFELKGLEEFATSPLTSNLTKTSFDSIESPSIDDIFNLLSSGYSESIGISSTNQTKKGLPFTDMYQIRIIPIPNNPNFFVYLEKEQSSGKRYNTQDRYTMSARVESKEDIVKKLRGIDGKIQISFETDSPILKTLFERSQLPKDEN